MTMRRSNVVAGAVGLCLVLAALTWAPVAALAEEGADSPEAVAKALHEASKTDDFAKIVPLIHPDDRPVMAMVMMLAGGMAAAFSDDAEAAGKEYEALLEEYGLSDVADSPPPESEADLTAAAREAFADVDLLAFMPDLFDFLGRHMDQAKKDVLATGEIADLEIEGDTATAMSGDQKVRFGKVGDRWYVRMEE